MRNSGPGFHIARIPGWNSAELEASNFMVFEHTWVYRVCVSQGFLFSCIMLLGTSDVLDTRVSTPCLFSLASPATIHSSGYYTTPIPVMNQAPVSAAPARSQTSMMVPASAMVQATAKVQDPARFKHSGIRWMSE